MPFGLDLLNLKDKKYDELGNPINIRTDIPAYRDPNFSFPARTSRVNPFINSGTDIPATNNMSDFEKASVGLRLDSPISQPIPTTPTTVMPSVANTTTPDFVKSIASPNKPPSFIDWWSKMEPDRKQALTRGLLATGLNMMALGGRTYDRPVSALGIVGQAGQAGLNQYEDTYDREQAHRLRKEYLDLAKEGLKLKSDIYKGRVLTGMAGNQQKLFKDAQSERVSMIKLHSPMVANALAGLSDADFLSQINNNPKLRDKVMKDISQYPDEITKWNQLGTIINSHLGVTNNAGLIMPQDVQNYKIDMMTNDQIDVAQKAQPKQLLTEDQKRQIRNDVINKVRNPDMADYSNKSLSDKINELGVSDLSMGQNTQATGLNLSNDIQSQNDTIAWPDPTQNKGRTIKDTATGKRYISDGTQWNEAR